MTFRFVATTSPFFVLKTRPRPPLSLFHHDDFDFSVLGRPSYPVDALGDYWCCSICRQDDGNQPISHVSIFWRFDRIENAITQAPANVINHPRYSAQVALKFRATSLSVGITTIQLGVARYGPKAPSADQLGK